MLGRHAASTTATQTNYSRDLCVAPTRQLQMVISEIAGSRFFPDLQRSSHFQFLRNHRCKMSRRSSVQPYRPSLRILPCSCQPSLKITSSKKSLSKRLRVTLRAAPAQSLSRIAAPPKRGKRDPPRSASGLAGRQMWAKSTRVASQTKLHRRWMLFYSWRCFLPCHVCKCCAMESCWHVEISMHVFF